MLGNGTLAGLPLLRPGVKRLRASSYDSTGGNADEWLIEPRMTRALAEIEGVGAIKHIWMMLDPIDRAALRKVVLRMYWDGEENPSVEVPLGDFFGLGHGLTRNFVSLPLQMSPQDGRGFNCWFAMPFTENARMTVENEADFPVALRFYIDYELYPAATDVSAHGRFHAQWRRVNPTPGWAGANERWDDDPAALAEAWATANTTGRGNYILLDAEGQGHYVGCHLDIDSFTQQANDWYGEGDDVIFVDGAVWSGALQGTGTSDYFNGALRPTEEFSTPYHGIILYQGTDDWRWRGKNTLYRYHIEDPIFFEKTIRVTIEHGHANSLSNDYASTAYWYQAEPHKAFPALLPVKQRLPR